VDTDTDAVENLTYRFVFGPHNAEGRQDYVLRRLSEASDPHAIGTDNAPDVMFSTAANTPIRLGIGRQSVTRKPSSTFPYVPPVS
jgi:hypothetical protein